MTPSTNAGGSLGSNLLQWNNLWIDGTATIDTLQVDLNADITGNLVVDGDVTLSTNDSDTITINGLISGDLTPLSNAGGNLGTSSLQWNDLHIDGTATVDTLQVDGSATVDSNVNVGNEIDIRDGNMKIFHNTQDGVIQDRVAGGSLILDSAGNFNVRKIDTNGNALETRQLWDSNGFVLYHDNSQIIQYTSGTGARLDLNEDTRITGKLEVTNDITAFWSSDERLKDNITQIDNPLEKVLSLGGYTFDWNENSDNEGSDTGVIAQEVEALGLPGLTTTRDNGYKAVRYEKLVPLLIEAIKDLTDKVSKLEDRLNQ